MNSERILDRALIVANRGKVRWDELQLSCDQPDGPAIVRGEGTTWTFGLEVRLQSRRNTTCSGRAGLH